jgi:hypothetical protein
MLFFFARRRSYIGNEPVEKKIVFQCLTNLQLCNVPLKPVAAAKPYNAQRTTLCSG